MSAEESVSSLSAFAFDLVHTLSTNSTKQDCLILHQLVQAMFRHIIAMLSVVIRPVGKLLKAQSICSTLRTLMFKDFDSRFNDFRANSVTRYNSDIVGSRYHHFLCSASEFVCYDTSFNVGNVRKFI